jgi:hypothetical protein
MHGDGSTPHVVSRERPPGPRFRPDRRRQIDAVIDYFGESREARAPDSRSAPAVMGAYLAFAIRFARARAHEVEYILGRAEKTDSRRSTR